jgi:hypothetical protein
VAFDRGHGIWWSELVLNCTIWKNNLLTFTAKRVNFDEFKSGGLHEKRAAGTGNLGTISALAYIKGKAIHVTGREGP